MNSFASSFKAFCFHWFYYIIVEKKFDQISALTRNLSEKILSTAELAVRYKYHRIDDLFSFLNSQLMQQWHAVHPHPYHLFRPQIPAHFSHPRLLQQQYSETLAMYMDVLCKKIFISNFGNKFSV